VFGEGVRVEDILAGQVLNVDIGVGLGDPLALSVALERNPDDPDAACRDYVHWRGPAVRPYEVIGAEGGRMVPAGRGGPRPDAERWPPVEALAGASLREVLSEWQGVGSPRRARDLRRSCLLYSSDAADDLLCVDLGGRPFLKKPRHVLHVRLLLPYTYTIHTQQRST